MKKLMLFLAVLFITVGMSFAQTSDMYVKSVSISKIYSHKLGYRVVFMKSNTQMEVFYVPKTWFETAAVSGSAPKAEVLYGNEDSYPYFSIFWKDGKFDHIRLYLKNNLADLTWGEINPAWGNLTKKFDIDTLDLKF